LSTALTWYIAYDYSNHMLKVGSCMGRSG